MYNKGNCGNTHFDLTKPLNINIHYIGPNPSTSFNQKSVNPTIDATTYIGPFSSIIGDVTIRKNVFIAPNVSIRADEGSPFYIDCDTNIQDGVILHGLEHGRITIESKQYSIYIGKRVTCAHKCIIHGPCKIGDDVFIGFNSIIFNSTIGDGCYISPNVLVTEGVAISSNRFVPAGAIIDTQEKADDLAPVSNGKNEFVKGVQHVNFEFPHAYFLSSCETQCSCGSSNDCKSTEN